jgi:hypothetical protein
MRSESSFSRHLLKLLRKDILPSAAGQVSPRPFWEGNNVDNKTIWTIIVTAAVTTVVTVTVTSLFTAMRDLIVTRVTATAKHPLAKKFFRIALILAWLASTLWLMLHRMWQTTPVTRFEVLNMVIGYVGALTALCVLMWTISTFRN